MRVCGAAIAMAVALAIWAAPAAARVAEPALGTAATASFAWTKQPLPSRGAESALDDYLSCPTIAFCMVGGGLAGNPFTGGFHRVGADRVGVGRDHWVVCASRVLCLAGLSSIGKDAIAVTRHPSSRRPRYRTVAKASGAVTEMTCAGPSFCATAGDNHSAFSRAPGRRGSWVVRGRPKDGEMLSCSAEGLCMTWGGFYISYIQQPFAAGSHWHDVSPAALRPGDGTARGACAGASSCLAGVGDDGALVSTSHVQDGRNAWVRTVVYDPPSPPGGAHRGVADAECPSVTLCVALAFQSRPRKPWTPLRADLLYSTNPFSGSPDDWAWTPLPIDVRKEWPDWIDCPSTEACVIDIRGDRRRPYILAARITTAADG